MTNKLNGLKLELGCGMNPTPGYLHQDITIVENTKLDFICDPWEISIEENTLEEVIALGMIEHLRYKEVELLLHHVRKLLQPKGEFLFDVPDMQIWSEYLFNLTHDQSEKNPFEDYHIWSTFYGWQRWPGDEHKSGWTRKSIVQKVEEAGFSKIIEGVEIFTEKGFERGRFTREGDAHVYIKAIK